MRRREHLMVKKDKTKLFTHGEISHPHHEVPCGDSEIYLGENLNLPYPTRRDPLLLTVRYLIITTRFLVVTGKYLLICSGIAGEEGAGDTLDSLNDEPKDALTLLAVIVHLTNFVIVYLAKIHLDGRQLTIILTRIDLY